MTTSPICHLTRAMIRVSLRCLTFPPVWLPWRHVSMIFVVVFGNWSPNELNESYNSRNENTAGKSKPNLWHTYTNTFSHLFTEILTPTPIWANRRTHNHIVTYMIPPYQYSSPTQWCQQSERNSVCVCAWICNLHFSVCVWKTSLVPLLFLCGWGMYKSFLYWFEALFCVLQGMLRSTDWWCAGCFQAWDVSQNLVIGIAQNISRGTNWARW